MLDDWLERLSREPPERRAKRQLRDVGNATRHTVKELKKHPNDRLTGDILHTHKVRVAEITRRGSKPPPGRRTSRKIRTCRNTEVSTPSGARCFCRL